MTLEHYPGMTEAELQRIEAEACSRWPLQASLIVHRIGDASSPATTSCWWSPHRRIARPPSRAAEFLMDYLKTSAPFWKRESGPQGARWVEASAADTAATARWKKHAAE